MKQEEVWQKRWGKSVILSPLWLDPCHLPEWARRHIRPSVLFGPCCLWGLDPFDPSGLFGLFGPFCLCLLYQRGRDPSLCLSLIQCLCLYRPEEEHVDFFLLYAAWVRSRAERPSVSYTKVVMEVAWTGHNLQYTKTN